MTKHDGHNEQLTKLEQLLVDLVEIPSINPPGKEAAVADYLEDYLRKAGLAVRRKASGLEGRDSLVATLLSDAEPSAEERSRGGIIFTGHMDVVPVSTKERLRWNSDPFKAHVDKDYIYARGACDMKSGLAAACQALCDLAYQGFKPKRDIALVITADEEDSMMGSRSFADDKELAHFDSVVVCEPTNLQLCSKSRGRTYGLLQVEGQTAHGSRPGSGCNALLVAHEFITEMMKLDFSAYDNSYGQSFLRPLGIQAGVDPWVVPDQCTLKLDARLTLGHDPKDIWEKLEQIRQSLEQRYLEQGAQLSLQVLDAREPWETQDCRLLRSCKGIMQEMNLSTHELCFTGTTDGTPLRRAGRDVVIIGPGDLSCAHQENERVSRKQLAQAYQLYHSLMGSWV